YGQPGNVLSIGRVQTPTLALVVERQLEIDNFKPEDYWEIKTVYRDAVFNSVKGRYSSEADAKAAMSIVAAHQLTVTDVQEKKGKEAPPRLFDLTSLQVECNKRWGWTADETLKMIQSLYEKKVATYPRVDTTYLPDDVYGKIPDILRRMRPYENLTAPVLALPKLPKSKKVFDNSKVTDHHAIIPTGESPDFLAGNEKLMYHLIARRFIAAFYPDCIYSSTTVMASVGDFGFKATGKTIISPGWREIYLKDKREDKEKETDSILPAFSVGESGPHQPELLKKVTQPPKFYTEGTLLRAMETAGKTIDDEELRDAMKENGIGRPSTRATIIETLHRRHYICREKKNIKATKAGIDLISHIGVELLKSAKLTGIWENKLRRIEKGSYDSREFIGELKRMINEIVISVLSDNSSHRIITDQNNSSRTNADEPAEGKPKKSGGSKPRQKPIRKFEQVACPECGKGY
ncbi:MAG: DNA topoisomerase III, partial [Paramuribaculum sp.]|nr:DNA topoisomerase III [Paramuribaculum sp.]